MPGGHPSVLESLLLARTRSREDRGEIPVLKEKRTWRRASSITAVDPGCVKTLDAAIVTQQTKAESILCESFVHEWTSARINLALGRLAEGFSHSQDPFRTWRRSPQPTDLLTPRAIRTSAAAMSVQPGCLENSGPPRVVAEM